MHAFRTYTALALAAAAAAAGCSYRTRDSDLPPANAGTLPMLSPAYFPDLHETAFDCQFRGGENSGDLFVRLDVENRGGVAAATFDTRVDVNGKHVWTRTLRPLAPGSTIRIGFLFTGTDSIQVARGDNVTVSWAIDDAVAHPPFGEILEYEESNNTWSEMCTVE